MIWILLVLFYGIAKGFRDVIKKKALTKNTVMEVLFVYTFIAFVFCIPTAGDCLDIPKIYFLLIPIKSFVIFIAWILSFNALDNMPISVYGVVDLSRIIFSTLVGVFVLSETISLTGGIGLVLVLFGLSLLKIYPTLKSKKIEDEHVKSKYVIIALISCIFNAISGCLDKIYMKDLSSSQLQFWYMLFLTIFYGLYFVFRKVKIDKSVWRNGWIYCMAILFFIADKALFVACKYPESKVTIMTLLKQSACIVSILAGKYIFKEKNIGYKIICAVIIIIGIIIASI